MTTIFHDDVPLPDSEEEEGTCDEDICNNEDLQRLVKIKCKIFDEKATTLQNDYILSLCKDTSLTTVVAGLSNDSVQIFNISSQRGLEQMNSNFIKSEISTTNKLHNVCGVRFLDETQNTLIVGKSNGFLRLYDLRTGREEKSYKNKYDCNFTCFDSNAISRIICAGTDQYQQNIYLMFFDLRQNGELGCFFESHEQDVTSVRFHPENPDILCSGSTDGLINVFNIIEEDEDDALQITINTERSCDKLNWHANDIISCITHTELKTFDGKEGDEIATFDRSDIMKAIKLQNPRNCTLINAHSMSDGNTFLLAGTNLGKGEILRSVWLKNKELLPFVQYVNNKQIVRESVFDEKYNILITGGESGIVSVWSKQGSEEIDHFNASKKLKVQAEKKSKKRTPY